jgi:3-methylcrotonyl-CoA carboxylase alpha subunit
VPATGLKSITRVLIANRGEIAVRIARTCRKLGIETVAVYSDADVRALHVLECDRAAYLGGSQPGESYLNVEAIIRAAQETHADALHPGYGLLSENPALAEACAAAGITFIGPGPEAMRLMGDKAESRKLAAEHNVPIVPGYHGEDQDPQALLARAEKIGFPVMIKAAAGGGGRGMRQVERKDAFVKAAEAARREAERAFGNGELILEKAIVAGRHVEVQVFGDSHGNVIHLGERDCSVQRRHQKVIEESPSPAVDERLRKKMGAAAVRLAQAVGYTNAGTVEFMLGGDGKFYFLEMNTRLQVEHGVTELRTGTDLVAWQIAVASGEPLPHAQGEIVFRGHALECRVYAEDPLKNYLPSPGPVSLLHIPSGTHVRNDLGTYEGDTVSTYYDPMIAKLLTWGETRSEAIDRMEQALADYRVEAVKTNLPLLRTVIAHPAFRGGRITTQFLDRELSPEVIAAVAADNVYLAAFGFVILDSGESDPWQSAGPLRSGGTAMLDLTHSGLLHQVEGQRLPGAAGEWLVSVDGRERRVRFSRAAEDRIVIEDGRQSFSSRVHFTESGIAVTQGNRTYVLSWGFGEHRRGPMESHRAQALVAPMPARVLKVLVKAGQKVKAHQSLLVLEAMKMEHAIDAPHDGTVKAVHCREGGRVTEGEVLIEMQQDGK